MRLRARLFSILSKLAPLLLAAPALKGNCCRQEAYRAVNNVRLFAEDYNAAWSVYWSLLRQINALVSIPSNSASRITCCKKKRKSRLWKEAM
ncbi:unnamed protein product [Peronospora belbahrii]|uniref:Secreted protein n=1 Tax=Peronospora belbahrii TaxID=622444 RepID=A0AAU9LCR7_9STRA|nr:unnamed protein product [Peronospora belbahrii]